MSQLEYLAAGIFGDRAKRQLVFGVPELLARHGLEDTPRNRRLIVQNAFDELRELGLCETGFVLIARQKGMPRQ